MPVEENKQLNYKRRRNSKNLWGIAFFPPNICEKDKVNFHSDGNLSKMVVKSRKEEEEIFSI